MVGGTSTVTVTSMNCWGSMVAVAGANWTRPCHWGSALAPMLTWPLFKRRTWRGEMVTVTGWVPGLRTRIGIRAVAPFGALVGSGGTETASGLGGWLGAAITAVALPSASTSTSVETARDRRDAPVRTPGAARGSDRYIDQV